jgi:cell wall-associated NlpC family hydrolase
VTVTGTNGMNLNCRTGAGTNNSVITSVRAGSTLTTRGAASGGWQPVTCNGMAGFVSSMYVTAGGGTSAPVPAPNVDWNIDLGDNQAPAGFANGDRARVNSNLNLRYEPNLGSGVATYAPAGTVVKITGSHAGNGYYPVDWDGLRGFMHGDYLTKTDQAASERGGSAQPGTGSVVSPGSGGSTATGNAIVDYAMGYVGYPYVWATAGPYSFDCSGFTNWVIKNVAGPDIGRGLWTQVSAGTPVSRNNLQPGDLVFHQNTYQPGLSHVGIYIGDNQMVNALNQNAGVVVSDITSDYWESRWYSAVRIN